MTTEEIALKLMEIMGRDYIITTCQHSNLSVTYAYKYLVWELDNLKYDPDKKGKENEKEDNKVQNLPI